MGNLFLAILSIYMFILVGYCAKHIFKERLDEKSFNLLSVYFLQVFLTFWGLLQRPIDLQLFLTPLIYAGIVAFALILTFFLSKRLFEEDKERSIASVAALIGNTGNLGIPLGIAVFGPESIPFTTLINLINMFIVYTIGVYFYSRGSFSIKESMQNIMKLPVLWFAVLALILNFFRVSLPAEIMSALKMGAYTSMVIQLIILGMYLHSVRLKSLNIRLIVHVNSIKFIFLPLLAFIVLQFLPLSSMTKGIILMEIFMPLAVSNVNLASLYNCKPKDVTALIFISSLLFLGFSFVVLYAIKLF
ncbi:AEC family transporter [Sulfurimonas sp. MAG313]|nr:AEC family transporter [Sulfurimonas sp. MAG313]MDF1882209.1 AEC family transporter [Sulfurimonas sp. MAG313]